MFTMEYLKNALIAATVFVVVMAGCETTVEYKPAAQGGAGGTTTSSTSSTTSANGGAGLGGDVSVGTVASASSGLGGFGGSLPACPPDKPAEFAVDQMFLGDVDFTGVPNPTNGWKNFGFNLDGRISTKASTDLCKPRAGGSPAGVFPDGNNGIDNSFGKNVLPILLGLASDVSVANNEAIANGDYTYLWSVAAGNGFECSTTSSFFLGGFLGQPPKFDGSDVWPVDASSLFNPNDPKSAKCTFPDTRFEGNVAGALPPAPFNFVLMIAGMKMVIPLNLTMMTFEFTPDRSRVERGMIGGVISTDEFVQSIAKMAAAFDSSFCDPMSPTLQSILNQIQQASDIMKDGSQNPFAECDGISIGLGFTMKPVRIDGVTIPPPDVDPCAP